MRVYARVCEERADCAFHGGADFDIPGGDINSGLRSWALLVICSSTEQSRPANSYLGSCQFGQSRSFLGLTNRPKSLETKPSLEKQPFGKVLQSIENRCVFRYFLFMSLYECLGLV